MPTVRQLNQRHPSYDAKRCMDLEALYEGDLDGLFGARLHRFLPQREFEKTTVYETRKAEAHYRNYLGAIVDFFAALLFTSKPTPQASRESAPVTEPGDFYEELRDDCDQNGTDVDAFFRDRMIDAMVHRCSWFAIEQPVDGAPIPTDRAQFDQRKLGNCWLRALEHQQVLDWETDQAGRLIWVITHDKESRRLGIDADRSRITETWRHYQADRIDTYAIAYEKERPPGDDDAVPLVGTQYHAMGTVPVQVMELPTALWVANRLKSPQLAHFRVSNAQTWGMSQTCYAMPVFKLKDPEQPPAFGAGRGIMMSTDEEVAWLAPPATPFDSIDVETKSQKDEIFRLAHQMALGVENNAAAVGRSAESKIEDAQSTRVVMLAFARVVKETMARTYNAIERVRQDGYTWKIGGLDDFSSADLLGLVAVMGKVESEIGKVPSKTFRSLMFQRLAEGLLPDLDEATKAKIKDEIESGTVDPAEEAEAEREAAERLFGAPPGTQRPGEDDPSTQPEPGDRRGRSPARQVGARQAATA